jgi:hypothetical protein
VFLEKPTTAQPLKIPSTLWNHKLITVFVWAATGLYSEPDESSPYPQPTFLRSVFILPSHPHLDLLSGLFPSGFPTKTLYTLSHSYYIPCQFHPLGLDHSNHTWRGVHVTILPITPFSPVSNYFIPLRSKYSPQHPSVYFLPLTSEREFHIGTKPQVKLQFHIF